jgi:hypothetical protein
MKILRTYPKRESTNFHSLEILEGNYQIGLRWDQAMIRLMREQA